MFQKIINYICSLWEYIIEAKDSIQAIYLVGKEGRTFLTVDKLSQPYEHVEIEFILNQKRYIHMFPAFHPIHEPPVILSAVLNDYIDITEHVQKYLMNDLHYLKVRHIIPQHFLNIFETLEILDEDCNSLIYRKLDTSLEFLEPPSISKERRNSHH